MANKTIQVKSKGVLLSHISLDFDMDIAKKDEKAVRTAINDFLDSLTERLELVDLFDMGKPKTEAKQLSEPTPIKQIIASKPKAKLPPAAKAKVVKPKA